MKVKSFETELDKIIKLIRELTYPNIIRVILTRSSLSQPQIK